MANVLAHTYSVIICTYNRRASVLRAINSVLAQALLPLEIIVVDNLSEDGTKEAIFALESRLIRYCAFSNGGVIAKSRNHGLDLAQGSHICFLDSDDLWAPDKLALVDLVCRDKHDVKFAYHQLQVVKDKGSSCLRNGVFRRKVGNRYSKEIKVYDSNKIPTSSVVVKTERLRGKRFSEDPKLNQIHDMIYWDSLNLDVEEVFFIPKILGDYGVGDNISNHYKTARALMTYLKRRNLRIQVLTLPDSLLLAVLKGYTKRSNYHRVLVIIGRLRLNTFINVVFRFLMWKFFELVRR